MDIEEKNKSYKLFLKSFLKINNKTINNTNITSFDLFISTTRVYKFTTSKWSKVIKDKAQACQNLLLEKICDTFKNCSLIKTTTETNLIDKIFNTFSENLENLKILDTFINFSIYDLNIKKTRLNISKKDKENYYQTLKQCNQLNLFPFIKHNQDLNHHDLNSSVFNEDEQSQSYEQKNYNEKSNLTFDEVENDQFELTLDY